MCDFDSSSGVIPVQIPVSKTVDNNDLNLLIFTLTFYHFSFIRH